MLPNLHTLSTRLGSGLQQPLPGRPVQQTMAPEPRRNNPDRQRQPLRQAGVLFLFYARDGQVHLPFIERPRYDGPHSGQIALPGGKREAGDPDLAATAVRETGEEIGVPGPCIRVLGQLTPVYIPNSHYMVTPSVGLMLALPDFRPDPAEVKAVLEFPLALLRDPACRKREVWNIRDLDVDVPFFHVDGHRIWGATAMMLAELLEVLRRTETEPGQKS